MQTEIPEDVMKAAREAVAQDGWSIDGDSAYCDRGDSVIAVIDILPIARAIMAERERDQWQPIVTAPKDGAKFLFIEESGRIQVGRMDAEWGGEKSVFVCLSGGVGDWYPSIRPTHWMPIPAPPKQEA